MLSERGESSHLRTSSANLFISAFLLEVGLYFYAVLCIQYKSFPLRRSSCRSLIGDAKLEEVERITVGTRWVHDDSAVWKTENPRKSLLLQQASPKSRRNRWHRQFANNLLRVWPALWTFVTIEGVEPTNNPADRALRGPIIQRNSRSAPNQNNGERFAERALSAATTCPLQRAPFTYLRELLAAHNRGDPFPALA